MIIAAMIGLVTNTLTPIVVTIRMSRVNKMRVNSISPINERSEERAISLVPSEGSPAAPRMRIYENTVNPKFTIPKSETLI